MSTYGTTQFTLNDPGNPQPWSFQEKQTFQDIIDTLVLDACVATKQTTNGHRHYRVYDSTGATAFIQTGTATIVFNDAGSDVDTRMEGDTDANLLYVDAGNDNIGIGVSDPDTKLEVFYAGTQLKLSFDGTDNCTFGVDTAGDMTMTPSGTNVIVESTKTLVVGGILQVSLQGSDIRMLTTTNDLFLSPGGNVKFGTYAALSGEALAGYITIKDAAGNSRKIGVVA